MIEHYHRFRNGYWYKCSCISPFDSDEIVSYGIVPRIEHRTPGKLGDINLWNL
jgi:hypothetical protein